MSHCGYFVTTLIMVTSGLLSISSSVENKICFNVSNQHICYFQPQEALTNIRKTWETAWNICQKSNATLPIIENVEVQKTFEEYLRNISLNAHAVWLGGRHIITKKEWQWSNKKPFYQPDLITDGDQNPNTHAVIGTISDSVSPSNASLRYKNVHPSQQCLRICEYSDNRCPADTSTIQNEHHHPCFKLFNNWLNLSEATKDCSNSGGYLATFDGDEFLIKAKKIYQRMQYSSQYYVCYYIGLHRIDTKSWFWMRSNNENSTMEGIYENWSDRNNRVNGNCLFATANDHRWEASYYCLAGKDFICQIETLATTTTKEDADKMTDQSLVFLIGAIAGITVLIAAVFIIIVLLRRHLRKRKADVAKSPKMSASYVKPKAVEKSDNSPAVYEEIQLKTTEEEDNAQQTEATVYAEITAPLSDRNHNRSSQQQGDNTQSSDTGVVYAAVEFTNNYN